MVPEVWEGWSFVMEGSVRTSNIWNVAVVMPPRCCGDAMPLTHFASQFQGKCDALLVWSPVTLQWHLSLPCQCGSSTEDQIMRRLAPGLPEDSKCPKGFVVGAAWVERAATRHSHVTSLEHFVNWNELKWVEGLNVTSKCFQNEQNGASGYGPYTFYKPIFDRKRWTQQKWVDTLQPRRVNSVSLDLTRSVERLWIWSGNLCKVTFDELRAQFGCKEVWGKTLQSATGKTHWRRMHDLT